MVSDHRDLSSRSEDTAPRKMPLAERTARAAQQKAKWPGISMSGEYEPRNALIDLVNDMREQNILQYIEPYKCTTRDDEVLNVKTEKQVKLGDLGALLVKDQHVLGVADCSTELRLRNAWMRRGLAFDQLNLITLDKHTDWIDYLQAQVFRSAPAGYRNVTINQILSADRALFVQLARLTRGGIVAGPTGVRPMEEQWANARLDPQVTMLLMPLPEGKTSTSSSTVGNKLLAIQDEVAVPPGKGTGKAKALKLLKNQKKAAALAAKGKGKGKGTGKYSNMPAELVGLPSKRPDGQPLCFGANCDGCAGAEFGARCPKGWHQCMKCFGDHSQRGCVPLVAQGRIAA